MPEIPVSLVVVAARPDKEAQADEIANRLQLPRGTAERGTRQLVVTGENALQLRRGDGRGKPLQLDFLLTLKAMSQSSKMEPIGRATGLAKRAYHVIDATAGWGGDSLWMARRAASVLSIERSAVVFTLLEDAWMRAKTFPEWGDAIGDALQFKFGNSIEFLNSLQPSARPDVVYMDAMYPSIRRKAALPGIEMQWLRAIVGDDEDAAVLFQAAKRAARGRVVVKRARHLPVLAPGVDFSVHGTRVRFDVYLTASTAEPA